MQNGRYPNSQTIMRQQLGNGIVVLAYENFASQSVVVEGLVPAGAVQETAATAGLAGFTAHTLMRGTPSHTFEAIYEALESVGAELSFSSDRHTTGFSAHGLVEDLDLMLGLAADALCRPTFPEEQVARVKKQLLTGLQMRANDTGRMANVAFYELVYAGHPYGRASSGYPETIAPLTRQDLLDFYHRHYGPQGVIVTVVGAIKAEEAAARVEAAFGSWHHPQQVRATAVPDMPRPPAMQQIHLSMPDKQQVDIRLGLPGPFRAAPDYLEFSLMNTILGVFGMMGRIGKNVREKQGLAYYAYSHFQGDIGPSPWVAVAGVAPEAVAKTIGSIQDEIACIQNERVTAEELADSQAYRTGSMPMALETNDGLADVITDMEFYGLGLDYLVEYPPRIRAITPAQIQAAAQKYLSVEQIGVAAAGPVLAET